jgi:hypothetical protein
MKETLSNLRLGNLAYHIEKDRNNHINAQEFKLNQTQNKFPLQNTKFDVRKHYKMLKENHPLYTNLYFQKEN